MFQPISYISPWKLRLATANLVGPYKRRRYFSYETCFWNELRKCSSKRTLREYSFMIFCSDIGERSLTVPYATFNVGFFFRSKINLVPWSLLASVLWTVWRPHAGTSHLWKCTNFFNIKSVKAPSGYHKVTTICRYELRILKRVLYLQARKISSRVAGTFTSRHLVFKETGYSLETACKKLQKEVGFNT